MTRKHALNLIRYAGYHNDTSSGMRTYIENRISYKVYINTFRQGRKAKQNGLPCMCANCKE